MRSRLDGEGGRDKLQPKHRDEHKDGEPSPPSFRGLDVRNGRIGACARRHGNNGDPRFPHPAFYSYAAPEPEGFAAQPVRPKAASYNTELKNFLLTYDDVRAAASPRDAVMEFFQSTYEAAANLGKWDRKALER